jgi:hypothetical protein
VKSKLSLKEVVSHYLKKKQPTAEKELRWFAIQPNLEEAIKQAALARSPSGKRLSHQRRIPKAVLAECHRHLLDSLPAVSAARSFEELHRLVASTTGDIHGIGELTVYDTALRIGAYRNLEPNVVFMHSGTRVGARRLRLNASCEFLTIEDLPPAFRALRPREIEDILCIYKDRFGRKRGTLSRGGC